MKNKGIALVVIIAIAIGGYMVLKSPTQGPTVQPDNQSDQNLGAVSGPDLYSPYFAVNGVKTEYRSAKFNTASTTRCALISPTYATSTLSFDSVVSAATTTDYTLTIAKAATPYATTTLIRTETVTTNGQVVFPAASTTLQSLTDTDRTFAPGQYLVVSTAGPSATAFDSGICNARFNVAN